jgi:transposase
MRMGRTRDFPAGTGERVAALMKHVADKGADQRLQCIWLHLQGQSPTPIASGLGWRPGSVRRVQARYLAEGEVALVGQPRGGRRRQYFTLDEERALLEPFLTRAQPGGVVLAAQVQQAYEAALARRVAKSTIYRLLARHGWRKVVPRPQHPGRDPAAQATFKGGSRQNSPASSRPMGRGARSA